MAEGSTASYRDLLEDARELGRLDGRFAAALEPPGLPLGDRCLGRTHAEFAALLWEGRPGTPPSGLELNAPGWYATGYADGLLEGAKRLRAAEWARTRRVFS